MGAFSVSTSYPDRDLLTAFDNSSISNDPNILQACSTYQALISAYLPYIFLNCILYLILYFILYFILYLILYSSLNFFIYFFLHPIFYFIFYYIHQKLYLFITPTIRFTRHMNIQAYLCLNLHPLVVVVPPLLRQRLAFSLFLLLANDSFELIPIADQTEL